MRKDDAARVVPTERKPLRDSSLFVPVPEAEAAVAHLRASYDRTAPVGFPAHVTLLYPFLPPPLLDDDSVALLHDLIANTAPFSFTLAGVCGFRGVVWLAPEPAEPFVRLTRELCRHYPHLVPYGDPTRTVPPHLTVARSHDASLLDDLTRRLAEATPIDATAREVWLLADDAPVWRIHSRYRFGSGRASEAVPSAHRRGEGPGPPAGSRLAHRQQAGKPR